MAQAQNQFSFPGLAPVSSKRIKLSEQQEAIVRSDAPFIVGQAFAGTGKSSTGVEKAHSMLERDPRQKILSICFNAANAQELKGKYPKQNTLVSTTHALAIRVLSEKQRARLARSWSAVSVKHELQHFGHRSASYRLAAATHSVLNSFFVDTLDTIEPMIHGKEAMTKLHCNMDTVELACAIAGQMWDAMNSDDPVRGMTTGVNTIAIPHNAYLKRFVMMQPDLGYHTIIFDEAQDANPIMLKLLHDQYRKGSRILLLGDQHQSIYEFNGAVNAMSRENLPNDGKVQILPLTQSWRFGKSTADVANFILQELKGETLEIEGCGKDGQYKPGSSFAYLARTNAEVLAMAASRMGEGVHWVGGAAGYRIHLLGDAYNLKCGNRDAIRDPMMKKHFPTWAEFQRAAEFDQETKILEKLVEQFGGAIPELEENLLAREVKDSKSAELVVSTAHKAKGLEWDFVQIADDFADIFTQAENWMASRTEVFPEQEVNLMYVSSTRAKKQLMPNKDMDKWFDNINTHRRARKRDWSQHKDDVEREPARNARAVNENSPAGRAFAAVKAAPI